MIIQERPMKILISYAYFQKVDLEAVIQRAFGDNRPIIFADSGAVTAFTRGKKISVQEYSDWLLKWKHLFSVYANLDVLTNVQEGLDNLQYMESRGLDPLPVFHSSEDFAILEAFLDKYDYVALGGVAMNYRTSADFLKRWFLKCFKLAEATNTRIHGFGISAWDILKMFPWFSVDSSTWGGGFRFGGVPLFNPDKGTFQTIQLGNRKKVYKNAEIIKRYGFDPEEFADREKNTRSANASLSALSYMLAEEWLWKYWGKEQPRYYMADSASGMENFRLAQQGISIFLVEVRQEMGDIKCLEDRKRNCSNSN